jgi:hypothetical protein
MKQKVLSKISIIQYLVDLLNKKGSISHWPGIVSEPNMWFPVPSIFFIPSHWTLCQQKIENIQPSEQICEFCDKNV